METSVDLIPDSGSFHSSMGSYYSWAMNDQPVLGQLNLDMVDRLGHQVIRKFREVHERGSEIGGILLGRVVRGPSTTTFVIDDYELVSCEYRNGALFFLSDQDKSRMVDQLSRLKTSSPYSAIGFLRSHTRKDLSLDDRDLALIREYFAGPATVSLLVKPFGTKPSTAGFFVWQNGDFRAAPSHFQFPFKRSELVIRSPERIVGRHVESRPPAVQAGPAQRLPEVLLDPESTKSTNASWSNSILEGNARRVEAPQPGPYRRAWSEPIESSAYVGGGSPIPIAAGDANGVEASWTTAPPPAANPTPSFVLRQGMNHAGWDLPLPTPDLEPPPEIRDGRQSQHHNFVQPGGANDQEVSRKPPLEHSSTSETSHRPSVTDSTLISLPTRAAIGGSQADSAEGRFHFSWVLLIATLLLAFGSFWYVTLRPNSQVSRSTDSLGLSVDRSANRLILHWNHNSTLIARAEGATLRIADGIRNKDFDLDAQLLRSGKILYYPASNDVKVRLEVAGPANRRETSAWVSAPEGHGKLLFPARTLPQRRLGER